jgi:indolepyruvate ferredoxin oxidoreductase alpha subunit
MGEWPIFDFPPTDSALMLISKILGKTIVMKAILSGNEAIARGAFEAGVKVASAYPGTPSTEILENIIQYKGIDASWAPNEKVSLDIGIGASFGGARALVAMKHVGVNVAADPLFTFSYTGVNGGMVLVTADDPDMHSSQNEQDNRNYAKFVKVPMLEPADSQECKDFTLLAFEISERFDTPVMLRTTTRISHSKSIVELGEQVQGLPEPKLVKNAAKLVMLPGNARVRHPLVEERIKKLGEYGATLDINRMEVRSNKIGIITSGVPYQYVREILPEASTLKLGMIYPLPIGLIREFASKVKRLFVVEELDPFIEEQVKAAGIKVVGKELLPICGELTPGIIRKAFAGIGLIKARKDVSSSEVPASLPGRPPNMCPGCPHRGVFYALNQLKAYVTGCKHRQRHRRGQGCFRRRAEESGCRHWRLHLSPYRHKRLDGHGLQQCAGYGGNPRQSDYGNDRQTGKSCIRFYTDG